MNQNLPDSVRKIAEYLHGNFSMNNDLLVEFVKQAGVSAKDILPFAQFDHPADESYGRMQIVKDKNFGIYIMTWNYGDFTAIHSHGHSEWGVVYFMGDAEHRVYEADDKSVFLKQKEILKQGTIAPVCGNLVHAMGNLNKKSIQTLHIYGSNTYTGAITEDSLVYELQHNVIRKSYGPAFINMRSEHYKNENFGIKTNNETLNDYTELIKPFTQRINSL